MPKRSTEEKIDYYTKKIKKLNNKKRRRVVIYSSSDTENDLDNGPNNDCNNTSASSLPPEIREPQTAGPSTLAHAPTPEVEAPSTPLLSAPLLPMSDALQDPEPLDSDLLEALGDAAEDKLVYGPEIHSVLAQRWLPILKKGLTSDAKEKLLKEYEVPENCKLLKAPTVNPELRAAVSDIARNRDKKIQIEQDQLGLGITAVNRAMTVLLTQDNKVEAVRILSDGCRILSNLHFTQTCVRKTLITRGLDKAFLSNISELERDEMLFGTTLAEKIKEAKAIEKQGKEIKKIPAPKPSSNVPTIASRTRFQGNWSAPPRHQRLSRGGRTQQYRNQFQYRGGPPTLAPPAYPAHPAHRASSATSPAAAAGSRRAPTRP